MGELEERLRSLAEPVLLRRGAELVDVQVRQGRTRLVRVIADRPGGIDLDTCAKVNAELSRMLDVEDPIAGPYTLEVTSPGLDRPLRTAADFQRNIGQKVRIVLAAGQREGVIEEVEEDAVIVRAGGEAITVRLDEIAKARILLPW